ncbi:MAG TPA: SprT-like domain-containing protein [bacterium]|nr:SprT-like domain-containing protein [bacterium]
MATRSFSDPAAYRGKVYHLKPLFDWINRDYFSGSVKCKLAWGRVRASRVRRVRQLGRFEPRANRIVLNPVLDQAGVPVFVVASVLHHEMCHAVVPAKRRSGYTEFHGPEFKALERKFRDYRAARDWIRANRKFLFQPARNHVTAAVPAEAPEQLSLRLF